LQLAARGAGKMMTLPLELQRKVLPVALNVAIMNPLENHLV
jgi:hypothetical protein